MTAAARANALAEMERAREGTMRLVGDLSDAELCAWPDPEFSPVGWHLGHVAFTEAMWIASRLGGDDSLHAPFVRAFAQGGRPKRERSELPARRELFEYMARVRERSREVAEARGANEGDPLLREGFAWWFVACHEHQHRETMAFVLMQRRAGEARAALGRQGNAGGAGSVRLEALEDGGEPARVGVPGGEVLVGSDGLLAYDNERPALRAQVAELELDAHPVTCAAWARFMRAGGYGARALWSEEGWRWREATGARAPYGWHEMGDGRWLGTRLIGLGALDGREPVWGVSFHEAQAYARWRGGRLPSEVEWEHACRTRADADQHWDLGSDGPRPVSAGGGGPSDLLGQVWEWTSSWFEPRPGFSPFPYRGYSAPYFGGTHRVLRGGSFATSPAIARPAFRNWYLPHIRQIFAGLRCAWDPAGSGSPHR